MKVKHLKVFTYTPRQDQLARITVGVPTTETVEKGDIVYVEVGPATFAFLADYVEVNDRSGERIRFIGGSHMPKLSQQGA